MSKIFESSSHSGAAWTAPWPFHDSASSHRQVGGALSPLCADFARSLAISAWAIEKPLRLVAIGLPTHATLDECLIACLRRSGWRIGGIGDPVLEACWDSRWEFVAENGNAPAHYRAGPSYRERLRLELMLDAWERISLRANADAALDALARKLARASADFSLPLALPPALLERAAVERAAELIAEECLHAELRAALADFDPDDLRHLAISAALAGASDLNKAVIRHGTEAMRRALNAHRERSVSTVARAALEPLIARLRRCLWAPTDSAERLG